MQRGHSGRGRNRKHNRPRRISGSGAKGTRCDLTNRLLSHRERKKTPLSKEWDANHEVSTGAACFRNARARARVYVCVWHVHEIGQADSTGYIFPWTSLTLRINLRTIARSGSSAASIEKSDLAECLEWNLTKFPRKSQVKGSFRDLEIARLDIERSISPREKSGNRDASVAIE